MNLDRFMPDLILEMEKWGSAHEAGCSSLIQEDISAQSVAKAVMHARTWLNLLEKQRLRRVIKGFILISRHFPTGIMMSASPCRTLYENYASRFPEHEAEIYRWITEYRNNPYDPYDPYDPFGTHEPNLPDTLEAYRKASAAKALQKRLNITRSEEEKHQAQLLKKEMEMRKANTNLATAIERGDLPAVKALVRNGANPILPCGQHSSHLELARSCGQTGIAEWLANL